MSRLAVLLALVLAVPVAAQTAHVRVDAPEGEVVVDGQREGEAGAWIGVAPGERVVALVDDLDAWNPRRAERAVTLADGDSVTVALALPLRLRVETLPIRAVVVRETASGRDTLGVSPLTLETDGAAPIVLVASLDGYESVRQTVEPDAQAVTLVLPLGDDTVPEAALLPTQRSTLRRTLVDFGIGAASLAAGAVAVHYKFRADAVDDRYRTEGTADFGDEALRSEALRLDRYSAVALGAMQVGIGALALRFVLR
ncbi:hypothetical protein [Rubrivirga marina]|uniref:PEGA domain-containing protein n=1 Tax=Rubrivirga marina TaxID=1196024 RepID=A0A271J1S8_9BACT|nr:hypothetical protein [Rubrivirga marina]PAP77452.1 hypothetical protein BSZ37_13905 [Rubrivirga marina]